MKIGALEAGGTKMVMGVFDEEGHLVKNTKIPTRDPAQTMPEIIRFFREEGVEKLGIGDICYLHDKGVEVAGGSLGIRDQGLLVSVTEAPYGEYFGQEIYPSVFDKAAKYLFDFANYQIFVELQLESVS